MSPLRPPQPQLQIAYVETQHGLYQIAPNLERCPPREIAPNEGSMPIFVARRVIIFCRCVQSLNARGHQKDTYATVFWRQLLDCAGALALLHRTSVKQ
jgi:hypothetical protein